MNGDALLSPERSPDLIALDEALDRLAGVDARKSRVVELRFFGGLTVEETAEVMQVSPRTVHSDWSFAKSWLLRELTMGEDMNPQPAKSDAHRRIEALYHAAARLLSHGERLRFWTGLRRG